MLNNHDRQVDGPAMAAQTNGVARLPARMNDLPDEIQHVTDNFVPLSFLLERLAQKTHNNLQDVIRELARKPVAGMGMVNGGGGPEGPAGSAVEDGSIENVEKKKALLEFARSEHANWVKALVITEWSKKATQISKLIDLENHMFEEELVKYEQAVFTMLNLKRNLNAARVPSPDLRTALQVLAQGTAPWMPDLGFIEPPPLTAEEQLRWLDDISTLLSLRLNLEDHDTIPYHFRDYTIASGRATFSVPGEFAVDLTLASDDFSEQLWFLDLRFLFAPAPAELSDGLRKALEDQINGVLATEGLPGCYRCLHEYVLTHKVNELRRQALELARGRWVETLRVEQLNRAISVQYWASRSGTGSNGGVKSWFIVGVHSGRDDKASDGKTVLLPEQQTSRLGLRWFRDGKEVTDEATTAALMAALAVTAGETVSAEKMLQTIIGLHIEHILSGIYAKLAAKPLFAGRKASLRLRVSRTEPAASVLEMQLTYRDRVAVRIDPVTGFFALAPQLPNVTHSEARINSSASRDPVEEGFAMLDSVRCMVALESLGRRAKSYGWTVVRRQESPGGPIIPVVRSEELRPVIGLRDKYQLLWLNRADWAEQWHVLACLSLSGDRWWLVKLDRTEPVWSIKAHMTLPLGTIPSDLGDSFFADLTVFATGIAAQYTDIQELIRRKKPVSASATWSPHLPARARLPALNIRLSELLGDGGGRGGGGQKHGNGGDDGYAVSTCLSNEARRRTGSGRTAWATDFVHLVFRGIDLDQSWAAAGVSAERRRRIGVLAEARLVVTDRAKFRLLGGRADHDVAFNARSGQFCLYLRAEVGCSVVDALVSRLQAIERVVGFLDAVRRESSRGVRCESVTLRKLVFSYGGSGTGGANDARWTVTVDMGGVSGRSSGGSGSSGSGVRLHLPRGCPHLRVADYLNRVASDPATLESIPFFLTMTLALHRALDRIEDAWEPVQMRHLGVLGIFPRALDWVVIRFLFSGQSLPQNRYRQLTLEVRLRSRRGVSLWQVRRLDTDPPHGEDIGRVLRGIFDRRGRGWKGLHTAVVASPFGGEEGVADDKDNKDGQKSSNLSGIEACLAEIDEGVRALLPAPPALLQQRRAQAQAQAQVQAQAQAQAQAQSQVQTARMG